MTLHGLCDAEASDGAAIRAVCRMRVYRLLADEMMGLDEAAIDALFNELSAWIRREGRAHRRMANMTDTAESARALPERSDEASPAPGYLPTYPLRPARRFRAMPAQDGNATQPASSQQDDPADQETSSGSPSAVGQGPSRIRPADHDAARGTREAHPARAAEDNHGDRRALPPEGAQAIDESAAGQPENSDQSSFGFPLDSRFRFKRLDRTEIGALAHRICEGGKKSMPADDAGDEA